MRGRAAVARAWVRGWGRSSRTGRGVKGYPRGREEEVLWEDLGEADLGREGTDMLFNIYHKLTRMWADT